MQKLLSEIKTLFTENFACFRKFWVYQFVISLLGVMVTLPLSAFISLHPEFGIFPYVIALIFCGGMFCFLIYYTMFEQGALSAVYSNNIMLGGYYACRAMVDLADGKVEKGASVLVGTPFLIKANDYEYYADAFGIAN